MRVIVLALSAVLIAPASASALIQVDKGIAGARLNNTKHEVRAALGKPRKVVHGSNDFGDFTEFRYRGKIRVTFQSGNHVTGVSTEGIGDRTRRGVGVHSTEQKVRNKVSGITCETFFNNVRSCHTGDYSAGSRVTDFLIESGRVSRVTVAFVID